MKKDADIIRALEAWQAGRGNISGGVGAENHLSDETLYQLAVKGGIRDGSPADLEHLSLCPACLAEWAEWSSSTVLAGEEDSEEAVMAYGFLKAAATGQLKEPLGLLSSCRRFLLSVYPDREKNDAGLVALEVVDSGDGIRFDGKRFVVRDARGIMLVTGKMRDGRLAGRIKNPGSFDFGTWTLAESDSGELE